MNDNVNALTIGTELNHYVIEAVLGSGGFGIVYKAHHAHLNEQVVIKEFLPVELAGRHGSTVAPHGTSKQEVYSECLRRFMEEGRTLVKLRHPNVVRCRDLFTANGTAYLVMDFEDGLPLDELVRTLEAQGSRYTEQQLLHFLLPLADGLAYIHSQGVLHRDIKPANVFIRRSDGSPVIIDFGAAKQNFALASQSQAPFTEFYAPIEQIDGGGEAKPTVDIHAFGGLMYRVVAGQVGPKAEARAMALAYGNPDPMPKASDLMAGHYSEAFLSVIDQCLAFKANERPQSMQQVALQLSSYSEAKHTEVPQQSGASSKKAAPVSTVGKKNYAGGAVVIITAVMVLAAVVNQYYPVNQNYSEPIVESVPPSKGITVAPIESSEAKALRIAAEEVYYSWQNMDKAFNLYQQAAALGSAYADAQLAVMYVRGQGVAKNTQIARQYRDTAVQKFSQHPIGGHEKAKLDSLAALVELDTEDELAHYRKLAEQGDANAQYKIGMLYDRKEGYRAQQDAVKWLYKAAEQGHAGAQLAVTTRYVIGKGVYLSDEAAHIWYLKAAEQDNPWAQYSLGSNYLNGKGVPRSTSEALKWLYKAAENGHPTAAKWAAELEKNGIK